MKAYRAYERCGAAALRLSLPLPRVQFTVLCARAHHALGDLVSAKAEYIQAAKLDRRLALPRLGMAQMYCTGDEVNLRNASSELEEALKTAPNFTDALKASSAVLACLHE